VDDHATNYTPLHLLKTTENFEMLAHKWEAIKGVCDRMCHCNVSWSKIFKYVVFF